MKKISKITIALFACVLSLLVSSCSGIIGYGVLLWNESEYNLEDGTVLPVYLKSNITKQYVVGIPGTKETIEIPLWKLTEPVSRKKALVQQARYADYSHQYAKCVLDGLPIRAETVNTSKQVYRLRKDEIVRVLYEGKGGVVTNGRENFEGKWLRVLASDGTQGWCFSYNLRLFEMFADGSFGEGAEEAEVQEIDDNLNQMLLKRWYPDYYSSMISSNQINLDYMKISYGFDTGSTTGTVSLHMYGADMEYPYNGVTKINSNTYKFNDTSIQVTIRSSSSISLQYINKNGMPVTYTLVSLANADIGEILSTEKKRRQEVYAGILHGGPTYTSSNYGSITFKADNTFEWLDNDRIVPSVIPSTAGNTGSVQIKYFVPRNLQNEWDGILTMTFEGMEMETNFLYKKEKNGLRISTVNVNVVQRNNAQIPSINVSLPSTPVVIFLQ